MSTNEPQKHKEITAKIRKLLNLAHSANEHEAAAATAKAMELLSKYNLTMDVINCDDNSSMPKADSFSCKTRQRLENWAYSLASNTAKAFDCEYYHSGLGKTVFIGVGADPEVCGWTYSYLYKTLLRLASAYMRTAHPRLRCNLSKKRARESFLWGAESMIATKLDQQKKITPVTPGALVPIKQAIIASAMPEDLKRGNVKVGRLTESDWNAGRSAARGISLSTPVQGSKFDVQASLPARG